jgi:hypothetical protein
MQGVFQATYSTYWNALQHELITMKQADWAVLERIIRVLEWVRVEEFVRRSLRVGRRLHPRCDLARAFCAKAIWGLLEIRSFAALVGSNAAHQPGRKLSYAAASSQAWLPLSVDELE